MRLPRTLSLYLVREVIQYTLLGLAAITIVFLTRNMLRFLDELMALGFDGSVALGLLRTLFTMLIGYTLPVAFLFGVLLAVGRLASNREIVAMRASGISMKGIVLPVLGVGFAISCLTWYVVIDVEHAAQRELRVWIKKMAAYAVSIEPGRFRTFNQRVLYVRARDPDNRLEGIMISDRSDPNRPMMIFAEFGDLNLDADAGEVRFRLRNGAIHVEPLDATEEEYQRISFLSFDYGFALDHSIDLHPSRIRPAEMSMEELQEVLDRARAGKSLRNYRRQNPAEYELHIHRRLALPLAPMLFALVATPLALRSRRGARSWGAFLCAIVAFAYYALITFSQFLALEGVVPVLAAVWIPNLIFGGIAWALLRSASRLET